MQVVVLAGGRGERLDPLTTRRPKPLLPLLGRPLLGHLLDHLAAQPVVDEIIVTAGYLGHMIADYVGNLSLPVPVRVAREGEARGTAGAVMDLVTDLRGPCAIVSGDALLSIDLDALRDAHRHLQAAVTLCVVPPDDRLRFGIVRVEGDRVAGFEEKPALSQLAQGAAVSTGCYVLETDVLRGYPSRGLVDFARDVFPRLLAAGARVAAVAAARSWYDIGTLESYRDAHLRAVGRGEGDVDRCTAPITALGRGVVLEGPLYLGSDSSVGTGAHLVGPLYVGARCTIGAHACVERSVLLEGCRVEQGSWVRDSVVDAEAVVPTGCVIRAAMVGCLPGLATPAPAASLRMAPELGVRNLPRGG